MASLPSTGAVGAALAAASLLAVGSAVPAAAAPDAPLTPVTVSPTTVHPGGMVDLRTFADCGGGTGTVLSEAFAAPVPLRPAADGGIFGRARIAPDTRAATYRVVDVCGGSAVAVGEVTIRPVGVVAAGGGWGALSGALPGHRNPAADALVGAAVVAALTRTARRRFRG